MNSQQASDDRWGPGYDGWGLALGLLFGPAGAIGLYLAPRSARQDLRRALEVERLREEIPSLAALRVLDAEEEEQRQQAAREAERRLRRKRELEAEAQAQVRAAAQQRRQERARERAAREAERGERRRQQREAALAALRAERAARLAERQRAARLAAEGVEVRCPRCGARGRMLLDEPAVCRCGATLRGYSYKKLRKK